MLERRAVVGGAAVTEEFHPGFRNSVAAYTVSLLQPKVIRDLRLAEHGLRIVERPFANFLPLESGYLKVGGGLEATQREVARFSGATRRGCRTTTERSSGSRDVLRDRWFYGDASQCRRGDSWTSSGRGSRKPVQGLMTWRAGATCSRSSRDRRASSGRLVRIGWHQGGVWIRRGGRQLCEPVPPGHGLRAAAPLLRRGQRQARRLGPRHRRHGRDHRGAGRGSAGAASRFECNAAVEVVLSKGVVRLEERPEIAARAVVANVNPKLLYLKLVDRRRRDRREFDLGRFENYKCGSATFRMNVALSRLPRFSCLPGRTAQPHHGVGHHPGALARLHGARLPRRPREGWSRAPIVEMVIPSTLDSTLVDPGAAAKGAHVASLFCQHFRSRARRDWSSGQERSHRRVIFDAVDAHAPSFRASVIASALSPLDLEREFGLLGGDIFHGALTLDQLWSARPASGLAPTTAEPDPGAVPVRRRRPSRRRRHRRPRPQLRARGAARLRQAVQRVN